MGTWTFVVGGIGEEKKRCNDRGVGRLTVMADNPLFIRYAGISVGNPISSVILEVSV